MVHLHSSKTFVSSGVDISEIISAPMYFPVPGNLDPQWPNTMFHTVYHGWKTYYFTTKDYSVLFLVTTSN
jgi:hypothetical protein